MFGYDSYMLTHRSFVESQKIWKYGYGSYADKMKYDYLPEACNSWMDSEGVRGSRFSMNREQLQTHPYSDAYKHPLTSLIYSRNLKHLQLSAIISPFFKKS